MTVIISDLIRINGPIFTNTGKAIQAAAAKDVRIVVVGNPCNTNCLIAMSHAPDIPRDRWFAMTRLDQNRAVAQLAQKSGRPVASISNLAIWGNHSSTQYPDFVNAKIDGKPVASVISDHAWLKGDFISTVQQRGAAVIKARGASSAASAANAALDTVKSIISPTPAGDCFSAAVYSDGSYGIESGIVTGLPLSSDGRNWRVLPGFEIDDFSKSQIDKSINELKQERDTVKDLLP
jgi:malate dehydrogenase